MGAGDIVWDFWNPRREDGKRLTTYRSWRWTADALPRARGLPSAVSAALQLRTSP